MTPIAENDQSWSHRVWTWGKPVGFIGAAASVLALLLLLAELLTKEGVSESAQAILLLSWVLITATVALGYAYLVDQDRTRLKVELAEIRTSESDALAEARSRADAAEGSLEIIQAAHNLFGEALSDARDLHLRVATGARCRADVRAELDQIVSKLREAVSLLVPGKIIISLKSLDYKGDVEDGHARPPPKTAPDDYVVRTIATTEKRLVDGESRLQDAGDIRRLVSDGKRTDRLPNLANTISDGVTIPDTPPDCRPEETSRFIAAIGERHRPNTVPKLWGFVSVDAVGEGDLDDWVIEAFLPGYAATLFWPLQGSYEELPEELPDPQSGRDGVVLDLRDQAGAALGSVQSTQDQNDGARKADNDDHE